MEIILQGSVEGFESGRFESAFRIRVSNLRFESGHPHYGNYPTGTGDFFLFTCDRPIDRLGSRT